MPLAIATSIRKPSQIEADLLIIPLYSDLKMGNELPASLRQTIRTNLRKLDFTCEWGTAAVFPVFKGSRSPFLAVIGLGDKEGPSTDHVEGVRRGMGHVAADARRHGLRTVAVALEHLTGATDLVTGIAEGAELANYRFTPYAERVQKEQTARAIRKLTLLVSKATLTETRAAVAYCQEVMQGITIARDLVNQPASAVPPSSLVETAEQIAKSSARISLKVLNRQSAEQAGFTAFLAVARGSSEEPYVIHLTYRPNKPARKKIFIVGKGVTFDSGGLSLKPAEMMEGMKSDMAGAATVLGLFATLEKINPAVEVHGLIATCENMPSGAAYRPGDILRAKNGKTIEVLNTDAEGRITLADALSYATEHKPDVIIDLATLTGACLVALGETVAGLWSNDETLQTELLQAAEQTGEALCALPLPEEYKPFIQSKVADLRNLSISRYGGAITAAMFLREFVNGIPWAHIDIAGPSYVDRVCLPYYSGGATGYGVRLLAEYLNTAGQQA